MPIVTTKTITGNANDGGGGYVGGTTMTTLTSAFTRNSVSSYPGNTAKRGAYFNFQGITIPKGAMVSSATFSTYGGSIASPVAISLGLDNRLSPPIPSTGKQVCSPGTTALTGFDMTGATMTNPSSKPQYVLQAKSVTTLVQALVNSYDYSSGNMMFYINCLSGQTAIFYDTTWGSTKAATLEITYLPLLDKTTYVFI